MLSIQVALRTYAIVVTKDEYLGLHNSSKDYYTEKNMRYIYFFPTYLRWN